MSYIEMESLHENAKKLEGYYKTPATPMKSMRESETPGEYVSVNDVERRKCTNCPVLKERLDELESRVDILQAVLVARKCNNENTNEQVRSSHQSLPSEDKQSSKWLKMRYPCRCLMTVAVFGVLACMFYCVVYTELFADTGRTANSTTTNGTSRNLSYWDEQPRSSSAAGSMNPTYPTSAATYSSDPVTEMSAKGGAVYIRWGRTVCPENSTSIYKGYAAGGHFYHEGGATNTLCLPEEPKWGRYTSVLDEERALLYGTEYESTDSIFDWSTRHMDVPCCVCQAVGRWSLVDLPARTNCFPGWNLEYNGYLMGSESVGKRGKNLICVDGEPEVLPDGYANDGGNLLFFVETRKGALPSLPYIEGRELACSVCTQ